MRANFFTAVKRPQWKDVYNAFCKKRQQPRSSCVPPLPGHLQRPRSHQWSRGGRLISCPSRWNLVGGGDPPMQITMEGATDRKKQLGSFFGRKTFSIYLSNHNVFGQFFMFWMQKQPFSMGFFQLVIWGSKIWNKLNKFSWWLDKCWKGFTAKEINPIGLSSQ